MSHFSYCYCRMIGFYGDYISYYVIYLMQYIVERPYQYHVRKITWYCLIILCNPYKPRFILYAIYIRLTVWRGIWVTATINIYITWWVSKNATCEKSKTEKKSTTYHYEVLSLQEKKSNKFTYWHIATLANFLNYLHDQNMTPARENILESPTWIKFYPKISTSVTTFSSDINNTNTPPRHCSHCTNHNIVFTLYYIYRYR